MQNIFRNHFIIILPAFLFALTTCKSADKTAINPETSETSSSDSLGAAAAPSVETKEDTPTKDKTLEPKICTMEFNPTRCYVTSYKNEEIAEHSRIYGWGLNPCSAKNNLEEKMTIAGLSPQDFGNATCSPDVSQGFCLELLSDCSPDTGNGENLKTVCKINSLNGKPFRDDEVIQSIGTKSCDAKTLARLELCKRNLLDKRTKYDVQCVQASDGLSTCAAEKFDTCSNQYAPKVCEVVLPAEYSSTAPQLSFARNECLARKALERRLCFMLSGVDLQQKILCRSPD